MALLFYVIAPYGVPDGAHAVGLVFPGRLFQGVDDVVEEADALRGQDDGDDGIALLRRQGLAGRVRPVVELLGHF